MTERGWRAVIRFSELGDPKIAEHRGRLARLEGLAERGGICVSRVVRDEIRDKLDLAFDDMGERSLKNIVRPMRVFRVGPRPSRPHAGETPAVQFPTRTPQTRGAPSGLRRIPLRKLR